MACIVVELCVCKALESSTFTASVRLGLIWPAILFMSLFLSRHLRVSEGISIFAHHCLCACLSPRRCLRVCLAPWQCLLALTILGRGWCHFSPRQAGAHAGWPRVSRLIVSLSTLCLFLLFFFCVFHCARPLQELKRRKGLERNSVSFETDLRRITLPVAAWKGAKWREIGMLKQHLIGLLCAWIKGWRIYLVQWPKGAMATEWFKI